MDESNEYIFTAKKSDIGSRLDVFAAAESGISRNSIQRLINCGNILLNGNTTKANYKLRENDVVYMLEPELVQPEINPENIPLDILFEDEDIIVVNKQKGLVVHPAPGHYSGTLVNALLYICKTGLSGINGVARPGIVHRIDKDTSGVLVAAKNDTAHNGLAIQLAEHSMTRIYYAIVHNNLKNDEGTVNKPICRCPSDRKKMCIALDGRGKSAVTHYRTLERFHKYQFKYTFIEARLETGRTHQIRVHMSSISHPLLGDMVYGPLKQPFKLDSQTLHAGVLGFKHPVKNEYMEFSAPLPDYFADLLNRLREGAF